MKHLYLSTFIAVLGSAFLYGQMSLPESRRSSSELFLYKLDKKDVRSLYLKEKKLDESMLHTFILSCTERKDIPPLPNGNYITVRVVDNKLEYSDYTVDNFYHTIIEDEKVMLFLSDTLGNVITDATVARGIKRLRFDKATQTYNTSRIGDEKIVEVNNHGVLHYIKFEKPYNYKYRSSFLKNGWWKIKNTLNRVFAPDRAPVRKVYDGFVVFNKPKYKPGETLMFKAYVNDNGRPYNEEAEVSLVSYYPARIDTVLTLLKPYRPGMYQWEFALSEELKLRLDNNYNIVIKTKGPNTNDIRGSFYYEEYELERITFEAKTDKHKYVRGDTVKLYYNTKDENGMPVYDGRMDITVRPSRYGERKYFSNNVFIPDEIWRYSLDMTGKASDEIILPDSIFVNNTAMLYNIKCSFLDSANEKHTKELSVYIDMRNRLIDFSVERGALSIKELAGGKSMPTEAMITAYNTEAEIIWEDTVMLPYSFPLLWMATNYSVETETASGDFYAEDIEDEIIGYRFFRENGNVRLVVDNPAGFPFWYSVRKGKNIIDKGYTTQLDYSHADKGKNGYTMQLSYLLGGNARTIQGNLPYVEKNISVEVNTPTIIYPGQTVPVNVTVKDNKGRPVRNADITAYAFTSKFGAYSPNLTIFGKSLSGKRFQNVRYETYEEDPMGIKSTMDWELWRQRMGLDSIEYYSFLYPDPYYSYSEKALGEVTQISPYIIIDGNVQGVHILYVDEQPHYFYQAQQLNVYSFPITPGYHTLKFRTYDREIVAENIYVGKGTKTIVSLNGKQSVVHSIKDEDRRQVRITVTTYRKEDKGILSNREAAILQDYMITVDNSFGTATFPNDRQPITLPAIVNAGGVYYYPDNAVNRIYDQRSSSYISVPVLIGPFPYRGFSTGGKNIGTLYVDTVFVSNFEIEGGYRYSIWNNYLKQQSWKQLPFSKNIKSFIPNPSFTQNALTAEDIRANFNLRLLERVEQNVGIMIPAAMADTGSCRLKLELGNFPDKKTVVKPLMIRLSEVVRDSVEYVYYGATRDFDRLPKGRYRMDLIFRDSTLFSCHVELLPNGLNYLKLDCIVPEAPDQVSRKVFSMLNSQIRVSYPSNPLPNYDIYTLQDSIITVPAQNIGGFNDTNYTGKVVTGTVRDKGGEALFGATVMIEGTQTATVTDIDGKFILSDMGSGNIVVSYLGFKPLKTRLISGYDYKITLEEDYNLIDDVVVVSYGTTLKKEMTSSASVVDTDMVASLAGVVAGAQIRGASSIEDNVSPLLIVNGVPYSGSLSDLDPESIESLNILRDASTAIYGSRAANGVIFIETKDYVSMKTSQNRAEFPDGWSNANTLRTNFHDDAFWRPALSTGRDGTITFEVTYPDDITSWYANFIAVGGRKQTDKSQLSIRSFKPLNAQLSLPQFAVQGDSLNAVGRLTNHLGDTVIIKRLIQTEGYNLEDSISLATSYVDTIPVTANDTDSIRITYSLAMDSGYIDGERRAIPIYKQGVLETHGEFVVLTDTAGYRFTFDQDLGKVVIHAEASAIQSFLDEIDNVDRYPYLCNEQMASKIKALLSKKQIYSMLDKNFVDDGKIKSLIKRLEKNQNYDKLWGWWNQDKTELWISKQIIEAILHAEAAGYKVDFNRQIVVDALIRELNHRLSTLNNDIVTGGHSAKSGLFDVLGLLKKLDAKIDYKQYFGLVSSLPDKTLSDRLRSMEMISVLDTGKKPQIDSLLSLASETIMGSLYWREKESQKIDAGHLLLPSISDVENTLTAYRILRETGEYEEKLDDIRNYFFEMRKSGSWPNTYESSRILETIIPDMQISENGFTDVTLAINGKRFADFPVTTELDPTEVIDVRKHGNVPLFFTAYQQSWNGSPDRMSKGFTVETAFYEDDNEVTVLQAGKSIDLKVRVSAHFDAEYVMIEVPIPAGCSYEIKSKVNSWQETHREYFKEKISIFCSRLSKGDHEFNVKLTPRYSGLFYVNPAKIELMYYPAFFGRNIMKEYGISN